jgi:hypothetical protein
VLELLEARDCLTVRQVGERLVVDVQHFVSYGGKSRGKRSSQALITL